MKQAKTSKTTQPAKATRSDEPTVFKRLKENFHQVANNRTTDAPDSPRAKILATAFELFAKKGFEATSVREIADAAKVNSAMIHYYYQSKENLYRRVMEEQVAGIAQYIANNVIPTVNSPEQVIFGIPRFLMTMLRERPLLARLMLREMAEGGHQFEQTVDEMGDAGPLSFAKHLGEAYKVAAKQGLVIDLPASQVAPLIIGLSYSTVFIEPFFRILTKHDSTKTDLWETRVSLIERLVRCGLTTEVKKKKEKKKSKQDKK